MSVTSKIVLGASITFAVGMVTYVHTKQNTDRESLHSGVIRDMERQERKQQNLIMLQEQDKLTKILMAQRDEDDLQKQ